MAAKSVLCHTDSEGFVFWHEDTKTQTLFFQRQIEKNDAQWGICSMAINIRSADIEREFEFGVATLTF